VRVRAARADAWSGQVRLLPEQVQNVSRTGSASSVQEAEILLPEAVSFPSRDFLHRAARAYGRFLNQVSLGLIRVVYAEEHQSVVLFAQPLSLLRFCPPDYELGEDRGTVIWPIERGLLVARDGRGQGLLKMSIERLHRDIANGRALFHVRMEVQNFYPWLRGTGRFARFGSWLYSQTQLRVHRMVTRGFLRSLANLDLPPAEVGRNHSEIDAAR
jgi:hypothetical protein